MTTRDIRIGSYVIHKGILCNVTAISASHTVYVQPRFAKLHIKCPVEELQQVELTQDIFKQLKFEGDGNHFNKEDLFITNSKGYPAYLQNKDGHRIHIGMLTALHQLQNIFYDMYLVWLVLP